MPATLANHHVLIAGLGDIGGRLAARLCAEGARVTGIRRGATAPDGVALIRADLASGPPPALPRDVDYAVVCLSPETYDDDGYRRAFVEAPRHLLAGLKGRPPARCLLVSSSGVYGQQGGEWVDEAGPANAEGFRARRLLEGEGLLHDGRIPGTVVRFSGLYGRGGLALIRRVLAGRGAAATPVAYSNRIHRDDAVAALAHLLARDAGGEAPAALYIATDDCPAPRHEVVEWLAERLGVALAQADEAPRAGGKRLSNTRLKATGFRLAFPDYRAGYEAVIEALEHSGELEALRRSAQADPPT